MTRDDIIADACWRYGVARGDIVKQGKRHNTKLLAYSEAVYRMRHELGMTLDAIAETFYCDHSSIIYILSKFQPPTAHERGVRLRTIAEITSEHSEDWAKRSSRVPNERVATVCYRLRVERGMSYAEIGNELGKDHESAMFAVRLATGGKGVEASLDWIPEVADALGISSDEVMSRVRARRLARNAEKRRESRAAKSVRTGEVHTSRNPLPAEGRGHDLLDT